MTLRDSSEEKFEKIKNDFLEKYKDKIANGTYHSKDIERLKADNEWVKAFNKHAYDNHDKAVAMIHEVLCWRNEFDTNNLLNVNKLPVPEELFKKGSIFMKNEDINCIPMLHFIVKLHKKDQYPHIQVCKFIAYFFERAYKFNLDDPIVLVFDMSEAGYANLDMDMIKFVVTCLKTYYPGLIDYMIIYQMPFIFNAAWKIIKNWLPPEAVKLIKFLDKKSIKDYIQESQLFVHMGGTDDYKYVYDPKFLQNLKPTRKELDMNEYQASRKEKKKPREPQLDNISDSINDSAAQLPQPVQPSQKTTEAVQQQPKLEEEQQVLFELKSEAVETPLSEENSLINLMNTSDKIPEKSDQDVSNIQENVLNKSKSTPKIANGALTNQEIITVEKPAQENVMNTLMLSISPGEELQFKVTDFKSDITEYIKLSNTTTNTSLAYKIKITSPDKFRVKPGTGIIQPSTSVQIMINFLKEFHNSTSNHRDKFLILWTPIDEKTKTSELNEFWKQATANKTNISEHKVKCIISKVNETAQNDVLITSASYDTNAETVKEETTSASVLPSNTLNARSESIVSKTKKSSIKKEVQNDQFVNTEIRNLVTKADKLSAKYGASADEINLNNFTLNNINIKLHHLENEMTSAINNQQRINKQLSVVVYLIYFLILINLIQMVFQSNFFTGIVEPWIDHLLFKSP